MRLPPRGRFLPGRPAGRAARLALGPDRFYGPGEGN